MPNTALRRGYVPESALVAKTLLAELQAAHCEILEQLTEMGAVTADANVDAPRCAGTRWRLSQASLSRRVLVGRITDYFLSRVDGAQAIALNSLRDADREQLLKSAMHIGIWSAEAIGRDWPGYCAASSEIRRNMHAQLALEQQVIYPILGQASEFGN